MYNDQYGGFSFSSEAIEEYNRRKVPGASPQDEEYFQTHEIDRHDPLMVQICSEMGPKANGMYARIEIEQIPISLANYYWIEEYDGLESVQIDHQQFGLDAVRSILNDQSLNDKRKISKALEVLDECHPPEYPRKRKTFASLLLGSKTSFPLSDIATWYDTTSGEAHSTRGARGQSRRRPA